MVVCVGWKNIFGKEENLLSEQSFLLNLCSYNLQRLNSNQLKNKRDLFSLYCGNPVRHGWIQVLK